MMWFVLSQLAFGQVYSGAAPPPVNAQNFRPTIDGQRTLWTDDALRGAHDSFQWRFLAHYAQDPLIFRYDNGETLGLVKSLLQADLLAAYNYKRFRFGVDLPIYLLSTSDIADSQGGLGELAAEVKYIFLDKEGNDAPVDLALSGRLNLPTSTIQNIPLADGNLGWEISAIADREFGDLLVTANLGFQGARSTELENIVLNDFAVGRFGLGYALTEDYGVSGELAGQMALSDPGNRAGLPVEWLAGGYGRPVENLMIRGGFGGGVTPGIGAPDWRLMLGFGWEPPTKEKLDTDGDGIVDEDDACPNNPEDLDTVADEDGCPENPTVVVRVVDSNGKAIAAEVALLRGDQPLVSGKPEQVFEIAAGSVTANAVAAGYTPVSKKAVVQETDDGKVITIKMEKVAIGSLEIIVTDADGMPIPANILLDRKKVGVGSFLGDVAPGTMAVTVRAPGYKPFKDKAVVKKNESTIVDVILVKSKAELVGDRIDIRDSVYYDTGKATIKPISFPLLDEIVEILNDHPELTKLRIEGHTDSRGSASYNKDLSKRRAASVRTYLIEKGIAATRLTSVGYGEEKPIDKRNVAEAWEKNRRVDFFVEERSD